MLFRSPELKKIIPPPIDGPGPAIGGGMIFFNSGYHTAGSQPGNVLLAFSVDGK